MINERIRQSGRSTRLIDSYIQELFTFGEILIKDHGDVGVDANGLLRMNLDLFRRVKNRIQNEHNISNIIFDHKNLTIRIIK